MGRKIIIQVKDLVAGYGEDIILDRISFEVYEGEIFVITADTESNERVVEATASAAFAIGAKPMVIWNASPLGVGKAGDH